LIACSSTSHFVLEASQLSHRIASSEGLLDAGGSELLYH
jgi:hypothetical protein